MNESIKDILYPLDKYYQSCKLCPRECKVDRLADKKGFCGETARIRLACACLHFGEEPCLCNEGGSGTVFFSGCTLKCVACQNNQISHEGLGKAVTPQELGEIFLLLQSQGAQNINLVTGTQFTPGIIQAFESAKTRGLTVPLLWNSSGYENPLTLPLLHPVIDIYLVDIKTLDQEVAQAALKSKDYPSSVREVLPLMLKEHPLSFSGTAALKRGVIVRHLVLPGQLKATFEVLKRFKDHLDGQALLSIMFQYVPPNLCAANTSPAENLAFHALDRKVTNREFDQVMDWLDILDIEEGYVQDINPDSSWLPDFTQAQPFPSALSKTVWHYKGIDL